MKTYSGTMTVHTRKRISRAIDMLLQLSPEMKKLNPVTNKVIKHRLSFITLTVANNKKMLTAKQAYKKLLAPFLRYFRDTEVMTTYIWKAELQQRGQIHYHITTPSIIAHDAVRKNWNKQQQKAGLLKDYFKEHNHYNPNSTDIHAVSHINDFGKYLAKEFCKTMQNETPTTGKLWDCSLNIKGAKYFSTDIDKATARNILQAHKLGHLKTLELEKCTVLKLKHMKSYSLLTPVDKKLFNEYLKSLSNKKNKEMKNELELPITAGAVSTLTPEQKITPTKKITKCIMERDEPCNPEYAQHLLCKKCPHKKNKKVWAAQIVCNELLSEYNTREAKQRTKTKRPI
jgi:hypothetical protein